MHRTWRKPFKLHSPYRTNSWCAMIHCFLAVPVPCNISCPSTCSDFFRVWKMVGWSLRSECEVLSRYVEDMRQNGRCRNATQGWRPQDRRQGPSWSRFHVTAVKHCELFALFPDSFPHRVRFLRFFISLLPSSTFSSQLLPKISLGVRLWQRTLVL